MAPSKQQRILGALLGLHAGDSLGATVEFSSWAAVRRDFPSGVRDIVGGGPFRWPAGHATDDTDLTRAVLLAYAEHYGQGKHVNVDGGTGLAVACVAADHMLDWYEGRWPGRKPGSHPADVGGATRSGLMQYRATHDVRLAGAGHGRRGNGSLMRCLPTGLLVAPGDRDRLLRESALISAATHNDWRCVLACCAYNAMVSALVGGAAPWVAVAAGLDVVRDDAALDVVVAALAPPPGSDTDANDRRPPLATLLVHRDAVVLALEAGRRLCIADVARVGPDNAPHATDALPRQGGGYVLETLTLAVAAVLDPRPLEDVLVDVVRIGNDTDTNGAVAGGLLGARDGVDAISPAWRGKLQFATEFTEIVERMVPA